MEYKPLSLKNLAVRRLAANLFKKPTILSEISNFHSRISLYDHHYNFQVWHETFEVKFPDEISKLGLPKPLSELLLDITHPMGEQFRRWKEFHEDYLRDSDEEEMYFDIPILEKLCWTSAGMVDYRKTAELLLLSDALDTVQNYKLACLYCFEDYISIFWRELSKENKKLFSKKTKSCLQSGGLGQEFWWPYLINGHVFKLDDLIRSYRRDQVTLSFNRYAFQCSAEKGNRTAAEHFYQKLTTEEKEASLMITTRAAIHYRSPAPTFPREKKFPREKFPELLSYLLSLMTPDQQTRIFQESPYDILIRCLRSPLPDMFLEIANNIWEFLTDEDCDEVLCMMYYELKNSGDYSAKLFQEFFHRLPHDFWIGFVDRQCGEMSHFQSILLGPDIKALEIFFRNLDASDRKRLLCSDPALSAFKELLDEDELDLVEMCLRKANLSHEDGKRLKKDFMDYLTVFGVNEMKFKTRKWRRFFEFLEGVDNDSKRGSEDEAAAEAKKRKT